MISFCKSCCNTTSIKPGWKWILLTSRTLWRRQKTTGLLHQFWLALQQKTSNQLLFYNDDSAAQWADSFCWFLTEIRNCSSSDSFLHRTLWAMDDDFVQTIASQYLAMISVNELPQHVSWRLCWAINQADCRKLTTVWDHTSWQRVNPSLAVADLNSWWHHRRRKSATHSSSDS